MDQATIAAIVIAFRADRNCDRGRWLDRWAKADERPERFRGADDEL